MAPGGLVSGGVETHPPGHVHRFGGGRVQRAARLLTAEGPADVPGDVVDDVLVERGPAVDASVPLVAPGEELRHLAHGPHLGLADPAARARHTGPRPLGGLVPPRLSGKDEPSDGVGGTGEESAAFAVHAVSPQIDQSRQSVRVPLGTGGHVRDLPREADLRECHRALQPSRQGFTQDVARPPPGLGAGDPHGDVRALDGEEFVSPDLRRHAHHGGGQSRLRLARLRDHRGQFIIPARHAAPLFTREQSLTGLTASKPGRGCPPAANHGSLREQESTDQRCREGSWRLSATRVTRRGGVRQPCLQRHWNRERKPVLLNLWIPERPLLQG